VDIRPLRRSELSTAAAILSLAFDADPLFRYFLPRPASRAKWLRWFHLRALNEAFAVGGAFTPAGGPETGAIAIYPPGAWPPSLLGELGATPLPRGLPPWRWVRWGLHLESRIHALHPAEPHLYVYVLGVHPSQKGRGLGGALLRHAAGLAKAAGVVAHLETSNPENLGLYRRFGYEVQVEVTSHGGPPVWTMTTQR
jgi:ribosomal protein S18 acetylase RimI-like enzyme